VDNAPPGGAGARKSWSWSRLTKHQLIIHSFEWMSTIGCCSYVISCIGSQQEC